MVDGPVKIGFIGLGNMGAPMSHRLAAAGYQVSGYDVSPEARHRAAVDGVEEVAGPGEAARQAAAVVLMLPTSASVAHVVEDDAFRRELAPGALVIDMSSSEPLRTRELAASLVGTGATMIDAPVSGGVAGAVAGRLLVMAGGDAADVGRARPYLEQFGRVVHAGPVGAGHAVKALNNLLSATHLWVTSEAMLAGERFGLDPEVMLAVLNASSGRSGSTENKWPNFILPGTFNSGFGIRLMVKDMSIAVQLAKEVGTPSLLGQAALELWARAAEALPATADHTEVARWLAREVEGDDQ